MNIQINPSAWKGVFALPCSVVDEHIKLAGAAQLKALLWIFRHNGEEYTVDDIALALGMGRADASDALQYWLENGILFKADSESNAPAPIPEKETAQPEPAPTVSVIKAVPPPCEKPTFQDIAKRLEESEELRYLFTQAQVRLGKTISPADQSTFLWLHDHQGLPVEVILMIIEYAAVEGKTGIKYIEKMGINWAENEIDTIEKAEEKITQINQSKNAWGKISAELGISKRKPSDKECAFANSWLNVWKFPLDVIGYAYEECVNRTGKLSFPYINKILEKWYLNGIVTKEQAVTFSSPKQTAAEKKAGAAAQNASYDIDEFERMNLNQPLIYKKEG